MLDSLVNVSSSSLDWLDSVAAAVAAIAAFLAVYFSAKSTQAAIQANQRESDWQKTQTQHRYYKAVVADPILSSLSEFRVDAKRIVDEHVSGIRTLHNDNCTSVEIDNAIRGLADEYVERQVVMMDSITAHTLAWGEADLRERVRKAAEEVQTRVAESFPALAQRKNESNFSTAINESTGQVTQIIRAHDPVFLTKNED